MLKQALLSVFDKTGLIDFAIKLHELGISLIATGGTKNALAQAGLPVVEVSSYTSFPEILDGRVKTLHPKIHAGLLARPDYQLDMATMVTHGIEAIDLLVVNLYPFSKTIKKPDCSLELAIENIDIGGPAMLRAAAKNYVQVTAIIDPKDYDLVINELLVNKQTLLATRLKLANKVFAHTAMYDLAIATYLSTQLNEPNEQLPKQILKLPEKLEFSFIKEQDLRYGENPHQVAAFYKQASLVDKDIALIENCSMPLQLQGKSLSYNNIADADAAWQCVKTLEYCSCVIVKHSNPCGAATASSALEAFTKALKADQKSAFGGIISFNCVVDEPTALAITQHFFEVVIATDFTKIALEIFTIKANVRLLQMPAILYSDLNNNNYDYKKIANGLLIQTLDTYQVTEKNLKVVSNKQPAVKEIQSLLFAWRIAKFVKSNAIVFCTDGMTLGIGAGQMSRIDAANIASLKAKEAGLDLQGSSVASDAFFPFRDGLDKVVAAGATGVIHPGGGLRNTEIISAANELGIVLVETGIRHFRH